MKSFMAMHATRHSVSAAPIGPLVVAPHPSVSFRSLPMCIPRGTGVATARPALRSRGLLKSDEPKVSRAMRWCTLPKPSSSLCIGSTLRSLLADSCTAQLMLGSLHTCPPAVICTAYLQHICWSLLSAELPRVT